MPGTLIVTHSESGAVIRHNGVKTTDCDELIRLTHSMFGFAPVIPNDPDPPDNGMLDPRLWDAVLVENEDKANESRTEVKNPYRGR
jgi:hypothetical protein